MRKICAGILMACAAGLAAAQPPIPQGSSAPGRLAGYLLKVRNKSLSQDRARQLIGREIMSLAEWGHAPSLTKVEIFAAGLVSALTGRHRADAEGLDRLADCIEYVLQCAGESTFEFRRRIAEGERILRAAGVNVARGRELAQQLEAIGDDVRGPEDMPVQAKT
jgi:hypothetical protein